jgi:hypothetical protein
MLTKRCFSVNYCLKDQNLDYTGQQSDQLLHRLVRHGYGRVTVQELLRFERKISRKFYRPTKHIDCTWRVKTNEQLDNLIEHKNIIHFIKAQRLRWLGHAERMP